jgi:hypothetical protein
VIGVLKRHGFRGGFLYIMRFAKVALRSPREAADHARIQLAVWRAPAPAATSLDVARDWHRSLHELLGLAWPCPTDDGAFDELWTRVTAELGGSGPLVGSGYDADPLLARAVWCIVRSLAPERVVETGVSRGLTTRAVLEALEVNGRGHLWSIDLPPMQDPWRSRVGEAVRRAPRHRWTYLRGASSRLLPPLCAELRSIDVFIHDSLHTEENVVFELETVWPHLRAGGVAVVDDAASNRGFAHAAKTLGGAAALAGRHIAKEDAVGFLVKRA